ncbi:MAG: glycosyltransferase family 4 protein [Caldilineaceae bacterium]|nr:glycosyltransferase family 4 protein [Caldilineaceae bacterium]
MKILFCNYEYPPLGGGGGVINALLAQELAKTHDVTVLTSQGLGLPTESVENGVRVYRAPVFFRKHEAVANVGSMFAFMVSGVQMGRKLIQNNQFDIINTHFVLPTGPVGHALARYGGIPNVLSLHGGDLYDPSKALSPHRHAFFRMIVRKLLREANMVLGQSTNTLENMRTYYTPEIEGVRIPLAIERPHPECGVRADYGFAEDEILLVTVGRLVPRKGVDQLITMMQTLRSEGKKVRLLVIGSGPEEEALKVAAAEKQVDDAVQMMGFVEESEKMRLLNMADIYVSTSQHEGFGLVFLEGMACGLPVVCYNHGGQTDFLRDGHTGYLVELNELETFTDRVRTLIENPNLRKGMKEHALECVEEYFIENCAKKHEVIFGQTIQSFREARRTWTLQGNPAIGSD